LGFFTDTILDSQRPAGPRRSSERFFAPTGTVGQTTKQDLVTKQYLVSRMRSTGMDSGEAVRTQAQRPSVAPQRQETRPPEVTAEVPGPPPAIQPLRSDTIPPPHPSGPARTDAEAQSTVALVPHRPAKTKGPPESWEKVAAGPASPVSPPPAESLPKDTPGPAPTSDLQPKTKLPTTAQSPPGDRRSAVVGATAGEQRHRPATRPLNLRKRKIDPGTRQPESASLSAPSPSGRRQGAKRTEPQGSRLLEIASSSSKIDYHEAAKKESSGAETAWPEPASAFGDDQATLIGLDNRGAVPRQAHADQSSAASEKHSRQELDSPSAERRYAEPRVQIGVIEVVVVAPEATRLTPVSAAPKAAGFRSRHYLRNI
jgi:hypothetical protein